MPVESGMYANFRPADMAGALERGQQMAENDLRRLGMQKQQQAFDREQAIKKQSQTTSILGGVLEELDKTPEEKRPQYYANKRARLIKDGVIGEQDALEVYDPNEFKMALGAWRQSPEYKAQLASSLDVDLKRSQINKFNAEAEKDRREKAPEKPTQSQFTAATFGTRAGQAENVFENLAKQGFDPTDKWSAASRNLPGFLEGLKSEDVKRQSQAERNFVNAILRRESGAAISPSEFDSAAVQYFPRLGDSAEVIKQKEENRKTAIAALMAEGAPAVSSIAQVMGGMSIGGSVPTQKKSGGMSGMSQANASPMVKPGAVEDGYVFMGGDPANPKSWMRAK